MSVSTCLRPFGLHPRNLKYLVIHTQTRSLTAPHSKVNSSVKVDAHGIPIRPTWSVNELLSSYPKPSISPSTLKKLHELSALTPPAEGTEEHKQLTLEMENLVKLVEAVKLVDTNDVDEISVSEGEAIPDGRIWPEGTGIDLEAGAARHSDADEPSGQSLLQHAERTESGLYVVDTDRRRK